MNSRPRTTDPNSRFSQFVAAIPATGTMVLLFAVAAVIEATRLSSLSALSNGEVWRHLRTGMWIMQNHGVPHTGLFSQSPELPWRAASWGYDLLVAVAYRILGLLSIPVLLMIFKLKLAMVIFLVAGGLRGRFWLAVALSATVQYILGSVQPGPGYCSILMFATELFLLTESRRTGRVRPLYWLPPLFLLWANLDIQFVYGLLLLLLFLADNFLREPSRRAGVTYLQQERGAVSPANVGMVTALCGIATVVTPYFYHPYGIFFASVTSAANRDLPDFHAMGFRQPQDYTLLLLTMAAFLALGLRRSRDPFHIVLMTGCAMLSFQAQRNNWLSALASVAVIAEAAQARVKMTAAVDRADDQRNDPKNRVLPWYPAVSLVWAGVLAIVLLTLAALRTPRDREALLAKIGQGYPVQACNYIQGHRLPQPLFNPYEWGGFLIWYLPEYPVAVDGRAELYGDDSLAQYFKMMNADIPYTAYPPLTQARTLLLQRHSLMGEALSTLPRFKVAYSDDVAVVLLPQE
jgi:hypothetical protein